MQDWGGTSRPEPVAVLPDLAGKSVFITGGGSGIGAALSEGFLRQGAKVAFVQRTDATPFVEEMATKHGERPLFIPCDITDTDGLRDAIGQASAAHGEIEVLVNNAANDSRHATEDVDEAFWKWSSDINLKSYFFACQAVMPAMRAARGGAIINFSSVAYMMGLGGFPIYTASNAAITSLSRGFARELGTHGIRVNTVAPGMVITPRQQELWLTPESVQEHLKQQCIPTALVPEDIVGSVLFLASDMSRMITGQVIIVDGGVAFSNA
ncbi:SDR family NAD(P)-dependent oxidoreductase [Shimia abyssi]|uniref:NAD(P)-dependent dehydrogenase (Short-subunit alcohol dehydrogenase family) n=1 Tax=Shimia abyssi TaxID=1662395 RepID=A0A2P8FCC3_9RHOB|nr:SDR family oxidoreductase [Shimia abyssi]PSL19376.1 NAD(P)-dependent dehydrogenase (short-subunit alcohol dehydrogenase family) [Shimia abyssi]